MGAPSTVENNGTKHTPLDRTPFIDTTNNDEDGYSKGNGSGATKDDVEATYAALVQQYLNVLELENATFLSERMVAECRSTRSFYLLALCHFRSQKFQRAISVLEQVRDPGPASRHLLAKSLFAMHFYGQAEEALLGDVRVQYKEIKAAHGLSGTKAPSMDDWIIETTPCPIPNGAAGLHLLGEICRMSNRRNRAIDYYHMSLKLDPLMWVSYQKLCEMGVSNLDPTLVFGVKPKALEKFSQASTPFDPSTTLPLHEKSMTSPSLFTASFAQPTPINASNGIQQMEFATPGSTPGASMPMASLFQSGRPSRLSMNSQKVGFETPNLTPIPVQDVSFEPADQSHQNGSMSFAGSSNPHTIRRARHVAARLYYQPSPETPKSAHLLPDSRYLQGFGASRTALFAEMSSISETPLRRGGRSSIENENKVSTARKPRALFQASENKAHNMEPQDIDLDVPDDEKPSVFKTLRAPVALPEEIEENLVSSQKAVEDILDLLCLIGAGYLTLCQFRCRQSLELFSQLPDIHRNTGWVLNQEGRAHFEVADYREARRTLESMHRVEPHRLKGLDLLSTVYWQLKKEVELSHLAQKVVDFDRLAPEAWCVVGNCFSLQKEHETALVFFERALQLDPSFPYPHSLSGYEYMANEDFEKAMACFRRAIKADERHYKAWYGLGAIYHRQEKYDLAVYHFQRAIEINPQSSILRCNLGMSLYSNHQPIEALQTLQEAFRLDPNNPQARFQRANIFLDMNHPEEALAELEKVRNLAPSEASIHFAIGKVLKRLGRTQEAMRCFLLALDLDPKDSQLIKSAMDKLDEPDVGEELGTY